jgi:hypothetical protein
MLVIYQETLRDARSTKCKNTHFCLSVTKSEIDMYNDTQLLSLG